MSRRWDVHQQQGVHVQSVEWYRNGTEKKNWWVRHETRTKERNYENRVEEKKMKLWFKKYDDFVF